MHFSILTYMSVRQFALTRVYLYFLKVLTKKQDFIVKDRTMPVLLTKDSTCFKTL
jgi:hypothetical protein